MLEGRDTEFLRSFEEFNELNLIVADVVGKACFLLGEPFVGRSKGTTVRAELFWRHNLCRLAVMSANKFNTWVFLDFFLFVYFRNTLTGLCVFEWLVIISRWKICDNLDLFLSTINNKRIQIFLVGSVVSIRRVNDDQLADMLILCKLERSVTLVILQPR
jgi:hypothetical protein